MSVQQHWFHCSSISHGQQWLAPRRAPKLIGPAEPRTPRLCVASSVARCFAARLFYGDVFVYRTLTPRRAVKPVRVWDACITQERWLIPPVPMILTHVIQSRIVDQAAGALRERIERTWKAPTALERCYAFRDAIEALGPEFCDPFDRRFVKYAIKIFESRKKEGSVAA